MAKGSLDELNCRQWKETRRTIGHAAELWIVVSISMSRNAQCGPGGCMQRQVVHVGFLCPQELTDPQTGLAKQEKACKDK